MKILHLFNYVIFNPLGRYYSARLNVVSLAMIIPMIIMGYLLYSEVEERIQKAVSEQHGVRYIVQIRPLLQHIPQHRGMSGGLLSGAETFREKMLTKQNAIDEMFATLAETDAEMDGLNTEGRVQDLIQEWNELKSEVFSFTPRKSFVAHTQLVANIIDLISHVADMTGLIHDPHHDSSSLIELIVQQMPILVEGMGQSRAIGAGVAAIGKISNKEWLQLAIRLDRIQVAEERLNHNLSVAYQDNSGLKDALSTYGVAASESVAAFSRLIQYKLLNSEQIQVSSSEIFSSSTKAIDAVFSTYDAIIPELDQILSERTQEATGFQNVALLMIISVLLLVFIVSIAFYKTVNRFKTTLDMTKDWVFMFDPDSFHFFYVNHAAIEQVGYSNAELMGMTPLDLSADFDETKLQELIEPLFDNPKETIAFETNMTCKDGRAVPVEITMQYINPKGEPARFVAIVRNIAERMVMQEQLQIRSIESQESQQRFAFAVEGSGDGLWDWDLITNSFEFSRLYMKMLGYGENELPHHIDTWINSVHPDDMARVQQAQQDYLEDRIPNYAIEVRLRCKNGRYKWILCRGTVVSRDDEGNPTRMIGIHSDITVRKDAESRLREAEEHNRLLLESVGEGIYGVDTEGRATFINPAACEMLGYMEFEMLGEDMHNLIHHSYPDGSAYPHEECPMFAAFTDGTAHKISNEVLWRKGGRSFPAEYTSTPVRRGGELVGSVTNFRDISERVEAERALVSARDEAERANKAKSDFLSSMSHELRTPMNAILGFSQLLESDDDLSEDNLDSAQEISKAGYHLLELINEVLDLAKIESGRIEMSLEPVEICPVVHECLSLVATLAEKRDIHISHSGLEGTAVWVDRIRFKQALLNLLSNAVKYNRDGGSVKLELQGKGEDRVRIKVTDTGLGISDEHLTELFQPFHRLDAENSDIEGTGIGLSITRRIVELMGGMVGVESEVGVGSSFWIELPLESSPESDHHSEATVTEIAASSQSGDGMEHTVLYIEDNPANMKLVAQILGRREDIHLLTADNPELGIELAMMHHPDLILLDINMPGMNGYQVLEVFKAETNLKSIPVVAVTANAMPSEIEQGMAAGFSEYLPKPLDIEKFLAVVDNCLDVEQ